MSSILWTVFSCLILSLVIKWLLSYFQKPSNFPPGPWGLPLIGYLPWMSRKPFETFQKLGEKYGGLFSVNLGKETVVVLNDWESMKATLVDQPKAFSGRAQINYFEDLLNRKDIVFGEGPAWVKQRKMAVQFLRNLGLGKKGMEGAIQDKIDFIISQLIKSEGQPVLMQTLFASHLLKTIYQMMAEGNKEADEKEFLEVKKLLRGFLDDIDANSPVNAFFWLRFMPPSGFGYWKFVETAKKLLAFLSNKIEEHLQQYREESENDFISQYIGCIKRENEGNEKQEPPFTIEHLRLTTLDLLLAGLDTTDSTALWGFFHLAEQQETQKKIQDELDAVVGRYRMPNLSDFEKLPYFEATIREIHRVGSVLPMALPHRTVNTTQACGYTIPKNTTCIQNIYAVHYDPRLWDEPHKFRPERFLDEDNKVLTPPYFMPFSVGPRRCIGQPMADMQLRLIFSCLLHKFKFFFPPDRPIPLLESNFRVSFQPTDYHLVFKHRTD